MKNPTYKADKVRAKHGIDSVAHLPVDVEQIAEDEGIDVVLHVLDDNTSGLIVKSKDGRVTIGVNADHHPNRRRFTVAHELGHFFLHNGGERMFVDKRDHRASLGIDKREIEANRFAAALLMPEELVRECLAEEGVGFIDAFDEEGLRRLAARFQVSQQAITLRLKVLGLLYDGSEED